MKSLCKMLGASPSPSPSPSLSASRDAAAAPSSSVGRLACFGDDLLALVDWLQKALQVAAVLAVSLAAMGVVVAALVSLLYDTPQDKKVVSTLPAGVLQSVTLGGGLFPQALVETDIAFYVAETDLSLGKGEVLQLQLRASGARYLCNAAGHCARLRGAW